MGRAAVCWPRRCLVAFACRAACAKGGMLGAVDRAGAEDDRQDGGRVYQRERWSGLVLLLRSPLRLMVVGQLHTPIRLSAFFFVLHEPFLFTALE